MTNTTKILTLLVLVGILAGCDDGSNPEIATGGTGGSAATNPCSGSKAVVFEGSTAALQAEVKSLCVGWTATSPNPAYTWTETFTSNNTYGFWSTSRSCIAGIPYSTYFSSAQIKAECTLPLTLAECADVAHDFVDSVGVKHGLLVVNRKLAGFFYMASWDLTAAIPACTVDGVFLGLIASPPVLGT
jgi:hypothetical protein